MICDNCKQKMNEESKEFCEEYNIKTCLDCCSEEYEENVKNGKVFYLSIPIYAEKSRRGEKIT